MFSDKFFTDFLDNPFCDNLHEPCGRRMLSDREHVPCDKQYLNNCGNKNWFDNDNNFDDGYYSDEGSNRGNSGCQNRNRHVDQRNKQDNRQDDMSGDTKSCGCDKHNHNRRHECENRAQEMHERELERQRKMELERRREQEEVNRYRYIERQRELEKQREHERQRELERQQEVQRQQEIETQRQLQCKKKVEQERQRMSEQQRWEREQEQQEKMEHRKRAESQWAERRRQWQQPQFNQDFESDRFHDTSRHSLPTRSIVKVELTGYYPADVTIYTKGQTLYIEGKRVCSCEEDCVIKELERKYQLPEGVDTTTLKATLDGAGILSVDGVQYTMPVDTTDTSIYVEGLGLPHKNLNHRRNCHNTKPRMKLTKIEKRTGKPYVEPQYKYDIPERTLETEQFDDGVTIETISDDYY